MERTAFNDPEWPLTRISRSRHFKVEYRKNVAFKDSYYFTLIGNYT